MTARRAGAVESQAGREAGDSTPIYRKLVRTLRSEIEAGVYPVGSHLPTEIELAARFAVSRHTVREATRRLKEDGLVNAKQGAGTVVVRRDVPERFVHEIASLADLSTYAEEFRYEADASGMVIADATLAARLDCHVGQRWLRIEGFRFAKGQLAPIAWTEVYVHADFAGIALNLGRRPGPIYLWIEEIYGRLIAEVKQVLTCRAAADAILAALHSEPEAAMIEAQRTYFLSDGSVALVAFTLHPTETFRHVMMMRRSSV